MKVLIVDDEPLARRGLRRELDALPGITCVGECASGDEAVAAIQKRQPDLVLLDIQLGRTTGFEVIERIGAEAMPLIVFVTAYDRHALRAFEVHAVDYVLKPVDPERLREALDRAARLRSLEQGASLAERLESLLAARRNDGEGLSPVPQPGAPDRLVVAEGEKKAFVEVATIDWIEAQGNYTRVHAGGRVHQLRGTLNGLEERLAGPGDAPPRFVRLRRSALVNVAAIRTLEPYGRGMYVVNLRDGSRLVSSRYHQRNVKALLGR